MVAKANLLSLPLELREQMLYHYFKVDGGYVYDAESDTLKTAGNRPIDLNLLYTCRTIAREAKQTLGNSLAITSRTCHELTSYW